MLFFICILVVAVFCAALLFVASKQLNLKMSFQTSVCIVLLMNMVSGAWTRMLFYLKWDGIYDFMDFGTRQALRVLSMAFLSNAVLCVAILLILYLNKGKDAVAEIKGYKILPVSSVQCFIFLIGGLYVAFSIADICMPQFAYWKIENQNLNYGTYVHTEIPTHTAAYGYPIVNPDVLEGREPEDKVILVIGDSFIWGDGTSNVNNLWWRVLQRKIADKGYGRCKVVAVGQCGASTQDELGWLSRTDMLEKIAPDFIIIGYVTNDPQYVDENGVLRPGCWEQESRLEKWPLRGLYGIFPNVAFKINNVLMERERMVTDLSEQDLYSYYEWEYQLITGSNLDRYKTVAVEPLGELLRELPVPYCLMTTPNTPDYDFFQSRHRDVMPLFGAAGIPVYDCLSDFSEKHGEDKAYFSGINPVNSHPGVATNAYLADYAMDMIEKNYPDVLGEQVQEEGGIKINDWMPFDRLKPSVQGNMVSFTYSDAWEKNCYLYMPMFTATVKICFASPLDVNGFIVRDTDGNICKDFDIWVSYINEEGYEELDERKLRMEDGIYRCTYRSATSLNLHRSSKLQGEQGYTIEIVRK